MRSLAAPLLAAFVAGALVTAAHAAPAPAPADTGSHRAKPFAVMARAAIVPGWGQLYNRKYVKAAVVAAGEGLLAYKVWDEFRKEQDAADRASAVILTDETAYQAALAARDVHQNRKITWIWWGVAAHLLQMADAYVDAHLASFEADFGPPEGPEEIGAGAAAERPRFTLAIRTRF